MRQGSLNTDAFADVANANVTLAAKIRFRPAEDEKRPRVYCDWHISVRTKSDLTRKTWDSENGMAVAQNPVDCFCTNKL